jgi:hypothetical protein
LILFLWNVENLISNLGKLERNVLRFSFNFRFTCNLKGSLLNEKSKMLKVFNILGKKCLNVRVQYFVSGTTLFTTLLLLSSKEPKAGTMFSSG